MMRVNYFNLLILVALLSSCQREAGGPGLPHLPENGQAISLLGDTLYTPSVFLDDFDDLNSHIQESREAYHADPEDAESLIMMGRSTAATGEYRDAIMIFNEGIEKHPDDPRMYRHRGHRYLTLREFDRAIEDFTTAEEQMEQRADEPEPDLFQGPHGAPASTLKSNVWYHLGLAHYFQEDFAEASDQFQKILDPEVVTDLETPALCWNYMALKRAGRDLEAGQLLDHVTENSDLQDEDVYLNLLLVFKGVFDPDYLMESTPEAMQNATLAYGIGNWHYMNGRRDRAMSIWQDLYQNNRAQWPVFGYIAAEAELAR